MKILGFDTCFDACSVCVGQQSDGVFHELASACEHYEMGHAERLTPLIAEVMAQADITFDDLDRIAVTVGPGTFTGTRIGVAAARGLALASGLSIVGVSSLAVMAQDAAGQLESTGPGTDLAIAVDARRGEVYIQLFGAGAGVREAKSAPMLLSHEEASRIGGSGPLVIAGSGAAAVANIAVGQRRDVSAHLPGLLPEAKFLVRMAAELPCVDGPLLPLYLRPPDAKPQHAKTIARV